MTANHHNPELENMEKILKREKRIRIFRIIFSVIFVIWLLIWMFFFGVSYLSIAVSGEMIPPLHYLPFLFFPILFVFEGKALNLQKKLIKNIYNRITSREFYEDIFTLRDLIKNSHTMYNFCMTVLVVGFLILYTFFIAKVEIKEIIFLFGFLTLIMIFSCIASLWFVANTVKNKKKLQLLKKIFEQINKEMTD